MRSEIDSVIFEYSIKWGLDRRSTFFLKNHLGYKKFERMLKHTAEFPWYCLYDRLGRYKRSTWWSRLKYDLGLIKDDVIWNMNPKEAYLCLGRKAKLYARRNP